MALMEVSIMYHVAIVLLFIWSLSQFNQCHPLVYFVSFIYLYLVHDTSQDGIKTELISMYGYPILGHHNSTLQKSSFGHVHGRYVMRLKRKMQFFERKQSSQRRVLTDSESVRWLNHAVEKIWVICMEPIVSQKILLPIIPWFLEKYKPWTAKKALVQHLYMGRSPPLFTEMRVLHQPAGDDHLVLELGMNFLAADDMSAILAVKLRKRLGFGMWAKLHLTGMHVEGKVLVGVKFLRKWPFLGRIRLCFVEPPYFQMTVKPIFTHGVDVAVLPGIAGWLDKILSIAFEQTLVEPNMLVVDMEKFVSPEQETWFHVDEKEAIAFAKVEVIEASNMKPSDLNGLADPYVKGQLGPYRVKTQIQKKTLSPKWLEEFMIPICTWESPNFLAIEVRDKDHFVDDTLGDYTININDLRDGQRHDMWLSLQNIKMGRLHLAITVLEDRIPDSVQADDKACDVATGNKIDKQNSTSNRTSQKGSVSPVSSEKSTKISDKLEPINVEGQEKTGIWVHQPGSETAQTWEPRKGKGRRVDTRILSSPNDSFNSGTSLTLGLLNKGSSENADEHRAIKSVQRGIRKITAVFQKGPEKEDPFNFEDRSGNIIENVRSPYANVRAINKKDVGVKFVAEEPLLGSSNPEGSSPESHNKGHMKDMAKTIFKRAEKGARGLKYALSRKDSRRRSLADPPVVPELVIPLESNSSDDESLSESGMAEHAESGMIIEGQTQNSIDHGLEKADSKMSSPDSSPKGLVVSPNPKLLEENIVVEKSKDFV